MNVLGDTLLSGLESLTVLGVYKKDIKKLEMALKKAEKLTELTYFGEPFHSELGLWDVLTRTVAGQLKVLRLHWSLMVDFDHWSLQKLCPSEQILVLVSVFIRKSP